MDKTDETDVVVIGGGISGLIAAYELLKNNLDVTIIEKSKILGGLSTSLELDGYICDIGPHFISLVEDSAISKTITNFLDTTKIIKLPEIHQSHMIFYNGEFKKNYPTLYSFIFSYGLFNFFKSVFSLFIAKIFLRNLSQVDVENYLISNFGSHLYYNWFKPYILHNYGTTKIQKEIIIEKFPPLTFNRILKIFKNKKNDKDIHKPPKIKNCYPKFGMKQIIDSLREKIIKSNGKIILNATISEIIHENKKSIKLQQDHNTKTILCKKIVYSTPPTVSINWFETNQKSDMMDSSLHTIITFLTFDTDKLFNGWIINVYDPSLVFFRLSQQNFLSSSVTPDGKSLLTVEIKCKSNDFAWKMNDEELFSKIKTDLKKFHFKYPFKLLKIIRIPYIYPIISSSSEIRDNIIKYINSFENEYSVGTALPDTGRFASGESTENLSLGGFYIAVQDSLKLVNNILKNDQK